MSEAPMIVLETLFMRSGRFCVGGSVVDVEGLLAQPSLGAAVEFVLSTSVTAASRAGLKADQVALGLLGETVREYRPLLSWPPRLPLPMNTLVLLCIDH